MLELSIASSAGDGTPRRRGLPRKHASEAARKLAWYHRQRQTGEAVTQDTPPIPAALYCPHCCCRQPVALEAAGYRCTVCKREVAPPSDPQACPRADDGAHNPYGTPEGWRCSRCNAVMPKPEGADLMILGSSR
jgi:hypothetical protein